MIDRLDRLVLTGRSLEATCDFYERVLLLERVTAPGKPTALRAGSQKINLHESGHTFEPKSESPTPGAGDVRLITTWPLDEVARDLAACGVPVEQGPVERIGAAGPMWSLYRRDPDRNLVEISRYVEAASGAPR